MINAIENCQLSMYHSVCFHYSISYITPGYESLLFLVYRETTHKKQGSEKSNKKANVCVPVHGLAQGKHSSNHVSLKVYTYSTDFTFCI